MITRREVLDAAWDLVADRYEAGESLDSLAKKHRITRHSLTEGLKKRGRFIDGRKNKPKLDECKRGHDLTKHGRPLMKTMPDGRQVKNGRECMECKRFRARVENKKEK